jgi:hypothetical protein
MIASKGLVAAAALLCVPLAAVVGDVQRLVGRALGPTPLYDDVKELCDGIGGRPTGSAACDRAVDWAVAKFKAAAVEKVWTEPFTAPTLWLAESAEGTVLSPATFPVRLAAAALTPSVELEAPVIDAGDGTAEDWNRAGGRSRGAIVLVHSNEMRTLDDLFAEYMRNGELLQGAQKAGAACVLLESTRPRNLLYRHAMTVGPMAHVPVAVVSREHAERIARLAAKGAVRMKLALRNRTGGPYRARNVIAEIPGREKPDEFVLIGAHLDSWDLGTGAEDNGINAAMVIDLARGFAQLGVRPRRTLRFVLFTGEEQGMWGSAGYVATHKSELDRHAAVVVFDAGSGRTSGFFLNGRDELRKPVSEALGAVEGLDVDGHLPDALDGTDNFDFLLAGVPNLVANQDPTPYLPDYHAESDTVDRVNLREAKTTCAVAAALLYGLAERPDRIRRQARAEVEKLLVDTKLDKQMKAFGQWDDWQSRRRGVE